MLKTRVFTTFFALATICFHNINGDLAKIDPELLSSLESGESANVLVFFVNGVQPAIERTASLGLNDRSQRNFALRDSLRDHTDSSQSGVTQLLSTRSTDGYKYYKSFWTGNKIFIKEANAETVKAVAEDPQVLKIKRETIAFDVGMTQNDKELQNKLAVRGVPEDFQDGLFGQKLTQVAEAWEELGGNKGEGVIVATIDSGVRYTHETLRDNYIGTEYGWHDARFNATVPEDSNGHGTHTMGTLAGSHGIGVAPGAKWMACRSSYWGTHTGESLSECIQWIACPTLQDGSNPDCSRAPHIVSNSWSTPRGNEDYNEDILVWRAMGIIPVVAIGNKGALCNRTAVPGELPFVIGVGFTNALDQLYSYSSVGWASDGGIKPDIVAPGVNITSADWRNDTWYLKTDGSSMATPLVAGVVALLKARNMDLTYDEAYNFLTQNTDRNVTFEENPEFEYCNESTADEIPNIFFGYGRVNALKAVQAQTIVLNEK